MRLKFARSLVPIAALAAAAPALAEEITLRVPYADLDLATASGVDALRSRVTDAAEAACAPANEWVLYSTGRRDCESTLRRKAFAEIESLRAAAEAGADLP